MSLHVQEGIYHLTSSRESPEKICASPSEEWYSESPPRKTPSPAAAKKLKVDFEALNSHSYDPECNDWDPIGKTPDEIAGARNMSVVREERWPRAIAWALKVNIQYLRAQHLATTDA